ncbi:mesoderm-specific transcript homolog protein-like [Mercenaria mercenaria]|uniref:mesoderm-specific transcript homolog protein-like n=1 Tax=Mercenaria mercenaria TaxID=6596 RepID=UPI00234EA679|nr:mesoderm-specific transcript homolog protein-like [Mercenaria mercenaria]
MVYMWIVWIIILTVVTVYYLNIPPPELSPRLKAWYKKGSFFKYKGFDIFYIDEKGALTDGSTLLLIHGFPTSSHDWSKMLPDLKKEYNRIILTDMLGLGFSDKPKQHDYHMYEQADILEAILEFLAVKDTHVLAHDIGDTVALELLHRHNTGSGKIKLNSLCLTNAGIFPETNFPLLGQRLQLVPVLGEMIIQLSFYGLFKRGLSSTFGAAYKHREEDMIDFYAASRYKGGVAVKPKIMRFITQRGENKERWVGALQKTKIPVHMIYGPADPINPYPAFVDHYRKVVPNPSIDVLPSGIGHYPTWEDPNGVVACYTKFLMKLKM